MQHRFRLTRRQVPQAHHPILLRDCDLFAVGAKGHVGAAGSQRGQRPRLDAALQFSRDVLEAAGATQVCWTGLASTHVQGTCRMGSDPERSVVDADGRVRGVDRLYVGDGSIVPRTLSVNPSLTIMALASRLAEHLHADPHGYLA